jgi:hypothetical protein
MHETKFHEFVANAQLPVYVVGNTQTDEYTLISLEGSDELLRNALAKGMTQFVGVIGIIGNAPRCALNEPLDDEVVAELSAKYLAIVARFSELAEVHMLQQLAALPDPRLPN